jgi:hypothetical protein
MHATIENATVVKLIEAQLARLDVAASEICACADGALPHGWVRISDGTASAYSAYGPASEILAALEAVEYDPAATVEELESFACCDPGCPGWQGQEPEAGSPLDHCHAHKLIVERDNGWQLAWDSLAEFADAAPSSSQDWPESLIATERLEEGGPNDNPSTLITLATNGGIRYAAGPHGANYCALSDWLSNVGRLAKSRQAAIAAAEEPEIEETT